MDKPPEAGEKVPGVLVVDDEPGIRDLLRYELEARGYAVTTARSGEEALEIVGRQDIRLVISDLRLPGRGGLDTLDSIKRIKPEVEVILATAYGTVDTAVSAMKRGAYDFVQKPFNIDELASLVAQALEKQALRATIAVYEASREVFRSIRLETVLPRIAELAARALRADDAAIFLCEGPNLKPSAFFSLKDSQLAARAALGAAALSESERPSGPILLSAPARDAAFAGVAGLDEVLAALIEPLMVEGEPLGVFVACRTSLVEAFEAADARHAAVFGSQIAQAVHNASAHQKLHEAQNQLHQSEKINSIGLLSAGVAHDLNSPLTSILGLSQLLLQEDDLTPRQRDDLQVVVDQARRCRAIISELLRFSRKGELRQEPVGLDSVLEAALRLTRFPLASAGVTIALDCPKPAPLALSDSVQLQQVFMNLITNAAHAMEKSYVKRLDIKVSVESKLVRVRLSDTGCGMSAEQFGRLFEPFFTTKGAGQGTGLGLSICRDILTRHGGDITAQSRPGEGTTFTVSLPLAVIDESQDPVG